MGEPVQWKETGHWSSVKIIKMIIKKNKNWEAHFFHLWFLQLGPAGGRQIQHLCSSSSPPAQRPAFGTRLIPDDDVDDDDAAVVVSGYAAQRFSRPELGSSPGCQSACRPEPEPVDSGWAESETGAQERRPGQWENSQRLDGDTSSSSACWRRLTLSFFVCVSFQCCDAWWEECTDPAGRSWPDGTALCWRPVRMPVHLLNTRRRGQSDQRRLVLCCLQVTQRLVYFCNLVCEENLSFDVL